MSIAFRCASLIAVALYIPSARGCWLDSNATPQQLVAGADAIIRAEAIEYDVAPAPMHFRPKVVTVSTVRFHVLEVVQGSAPADVTLPGEFVQDDDFNDRPSPYSDGRRGGSGGSCFAHAYRKHAQYLLFLKKQTDSAQMTVEWSGRAPVNEQLHSANDPWIRWVRDEAATLRHRRERY